MSTLPFRSNLVGHHGRWLPSVAVVHMVYRLPFRIKGKTQSLPGPEGPPQTVRVQSGASWHLNKEIAFRIRTNFIMVTFVLVLKQNRFLMVYHKVLSGPLSFLLSLQK